MIYRSRFLRLCGFGCALSAMLWALVPCHAGDDRPADASARLRVLRGKNLEGVPRGALDSIEHLTDVASRYAAQEPSNAKRYLCEALRLIEKAEEGVDPFEDERGFVIRGYRSEASTEIQPYSIYVPDSYDPKRATPLLVVLHGGSSNHALFLGVVFGNNVEWKTYRKNLRTLYHPLFETDWLVVTPNGFGQVMWRWLGEKDVLDVIDDVKRHYNVDENRIVLNGISNGGVGAYSIGARHAWLFSAVIPMAGAPSFRQYLSAAMTPLERGLVAAVGGWDAAENLKNTTFRFYHGSRDTGPMRPRYVKEFRAHLKENGVPFDYREFDKGHDIMYPVHRRLAFLDELEKIRRNPRPKRVDLVAWDLRARRQHWLEVRRIDEAMKPAKVRAAVRKDNRTVDIVAKNASRLWIHLDDCPLDETFDVRFIVNGKEAAQLGGARPEILELWRAADGWRTGPAPKVQGLEKKPGLSGPLTDVLWTCQVHVYGTGVKQDEAALRKAAEIGAKGAWVQWAWGVEHPVLADRELTEEHMCRCAAVLYGNEKSNAVIARMAAQLPIRADDKAVVFGERSYAGKDLGSRFIYPNPLAPNRYVVLQIGTSAKAVRLGNNLPDFLPDYVIYDAKSLQKRGRGVFGPGKQPLEAGFFDARWR